MPILIHNRTGAVVHQRRIRLQQANAPKSSSIIALQPQEYTQEPMANSYASLFETASEAFGRVCGMKHVYGSLRKL